MELALKERLSKRLDAMKVEGSWRMKLAVYGGALLMVSFILLSMYLLLGGVGGGEPEVGQVTLKSEGQEYTPLSHQIYTTHKGEREESRRLVPAEVGDKAPRAVFGHSTSILFEGRSDNGGFYFTIYNEEGRGLHRDRRLLPVPPGARGLPCVRGVLLGHLPGEHRHGVLLLAGGDRGVSGLPGGRRGLT